MKNKCFLLFAIFPILFSCGGNNSSKSNLPTNFYLEDKYYKKVETEESPFNLIESTANLDDLLETNTSFAIYVFSPTCSTCANFSPILTSYLRKKNVIFEKVDIEYSSQSQYSIKDIKYTPSVALYNKGNLVRFLDATSDKDIPYFESENGFDAFFRSYVNIKEIN